MAIELFNQGNHRCLVFTDAGGDGSVGVQSNQFLVEHDGHAAVIDPGGDLTYGELYTQLNNEITVKDLDYLLISHQDPDVAGSLSKWVAGTECKIVVAKLWERFLPHFCRSAKVSELNRRIIPIPDQGITLDLGGAALLALPAHFMHSEGNFQFYDPISRILFSGDMGASLLDGDLRRKSTVEDFDDHIQHMQGFHERYMSSNKICRLWVNMVRKLDVDWIIPQHGASFKGKDMVQRFLGWVENLECGVDLMTQDNYRIPKHHREEDQWSA